ncbi:MAG TPA: hypothetical protein QF621_07530 [Candidatus Thalassarchaeaceae archaeon]|jgi:hypothetical protein|nr:hypothetical protein [Candidatus Thalassarchaeaceae archaeon]HJL60186.1 hypothetical protein [Candidatus Thalassarchaeaceae archaeon]HJM87421.1 hypothetical protein [Candidatus Thalassarchaeaceae archaeon]
MTQKKLTQQRNELSAKVEELRKQVMEQQAGLEEQKKLVNTLLTIIMEEADGVQSGAAPTIPNQPSRGYCM